MAEKLVYFLSDAHLGSRAIGDPRAHERKLVSFLDSIKDKAAAIYLLGDMFDFWFEYRTVVPKGHVRFLGKIAEIADSGVEVHFFAGNHDMWVRDYLATEIGATIHLGPLRTQIGGKSLYLAHGDGLGKGDRGYKILRWIFTNRALRFLFALLHPDTALWLAHKWSNHSRASKGLVASEFDPQRDIIYRYAAGIESERHTDYYIFGHRHLAVDRPVGDAGARFLFLGDWLTLFTYAVLDQSGLRLERFEAAD